MFVQAPSEKTPGGVAGNCGLFRHLNLNHSIRPRATLLTPSLTFYLSTFCFGFNSTRAFHETNKHDDPRTYGHSCSSPSSNYRCYDVQRLFPNVKCVVFSFIILYSLDDLRSLFVAESSGPSPPTMGQAPSPVAHRPTHRPRHSTYSSSESYCSYFPTFIWL